MAEGSQPTGDHRDPPSAAGQGRWRRLWTRKWARGIVVFGLPAWFLSRLLVHFSGGVLWIPTPWRSALEILALGAGYLVFTSCRRALPGSARDSRRRWVTHAILTAVCFLAAVTCLVKYMSLRLETLVRVEMETSYAVAFFNLETTGPDGRVRSDSWRSQEDLDRVLADLGPPLYLRRHGQLVTGWLLTPFGFPNAAPSQELREVIMDANYHTTGSWVATAIKYELEDLLDTISAHERDALSRTIAFYLAIYFVLMLSASAAYGCTFSLTTEIFAMG